MQLTELIFSPFVCICDPIILPATTAAAHMALSRPGTFHAIATMFNGLAEQSGFAGLLMH